MSDAHSHNQPTPPFETLGLQLKLVREQHNESLAEASGAVEIDVEALERIEAGHDRPAEDILLLLINHYAIQDPAAVQLWELAGYEDLPADDRLAGNTDNRSQTGRQPTIMMIAIDVRTMYSDSAQIAANDAGVVIQFSQTGDKQQAVPVARVGMSYEQAEKVLHNLQQSLLQAKYLGGPKKLPQPKKEV